MLDAVGTLAQLQLRVKIHAQLGIFAVRERVVSIKPGLSQPSLPNHVDPLTSIRCRVKVNVPRFPQDITPSEVMSIPEITLFPVHPDRIVLVEFKICVQQGCTIP